jgi:two-component system OmpR family sensor kinase/two-component system sensor histidine kinase QseC
VALYHLVASVVAGFGSRITAKQLDLSLQGSEEALVTTDESLLRLMISNLIDNALKYTPAAGKVEIAVAAENDGWLLSISDTGPGIPEDQRQAVFQRFYRVDSPKEDGSGLGLAIVADVASRLSAVVDLSTPPWGYGLEVSLRLAAAP